MKVFFIINFVILLLIAIIYITFIVKIKINITISEAILCIKLGMFKFKKKLVFRFDYFNLIKKIFNKKSNQRKKLPFKINIFYLIKPFFIKNIDIYSECFEEKFSVAIEFSVVNIITKRGVFSE